MCNSNCISWGISHILKQEVEGKGILEVGSFDVNGSLKSSILLLGPSRYIGVDIVEGPGVDIICRCEDLVEKFGLNSFDFVVSTCTLEHIEDWRSSISNIKRVCKPEGKILIIVPSVWPIHDYPSDYWRFGKEDLGNIFSDFRIEYLEEIHENLDEALVYLKCCKPEFFCEKHFDYYLMRRVK